LDQFDYYADRFGDSRPVGMEKVPSSYFGTQVFATFFRDPVGMRMFEWWGSDGCMWSSDYPHGNSTWPNSRQVVADNLGYLAPEIRAKIVRENARSLYRLNS
jgi:predicted TIM-barrel fold metal-dependent hydrolase